jgi:hypothetical protein
MLAGGFVYEVHALALFLASDESIISLAGDEFV